MRIEQTTLIVADQDQAIRFFVDTLGFELVEDAPATTGAGRPKRWIVVRPPGGGAGLLLAAADGDDQVAAVGRQAAGRVGWFLRVDDFDETFRRLNESGVVFVDGPRSEPYGSVAVFLDVAGNRWDLLGPASPGNREPTAARSAVTVRRETPADQPAVRAVQAAAFAEGREEPVEVRLLDQLRGCTGWLPSLSWVAELDGEVVGHNVCTRGAVGDVPALGLGPIGVRPDRQADGVGSRLMWAMIGAADALGEPLIALLGDPAYYRRFGFRPSTDLGIDPPEARWGENFQALPLSSWTPAITGPFRYAAPFDTVS